MNNYSNFQRKLISQELLDLVSEHAPTLMIGIVNLFTFNHRTVLLAMIIGALLNHKDDIYNLSEIALKHEGFVDKLKDLEEFFIKLGKDALDASTKDFLYEVPTGGLPH